MNLGDPRKLNGMEKELAKKGLGSHWQETN